MSKKLIPNVVTVLNMVFGIAALWYTMEGYYKQAAVAILIAMVMDTIDGRLARRWHVSSEFGKELDSLADLISFGVAPALLLYSSVLYLLGGGGLIVAIVFALCGAVRLARFNVLNIKTYFVGLPITVAGPLVAVTVLLSNILPLYFYPVFSFLLSYLMVSNIRMPKL